MKKNLIILYLLFLGEHITFAQNLVPNPSFENNDSIPTTDGQYYFVVDWKYGVKTPDYFHKDADCCIANIPYTFLGTMSQNNASEGLACMGVVTYMDGYPDYREYIQCNLLDTLKKNHVYEISLNVLSNTNPLIYGGVAFSHLGILFSKDTVKSFSLNGLVVKNPQCVDTNLLYATTWHKMTFQFVADKKYTHMTIGCFVPDSVQTRQIIFNAPPWGFECGYIFIDDIHLTGVVSTGIQQEQVMQLPDSGEVKFYDILGREIPAPSGIYIEKSAGRYQKKFLVRN